MRIDVFAKSRKEIPYEMELSQVISDENSNTTGPIAMVKNDTYGDLKKATISSKDTSLILEDLNFEDTMSLTLLPAEVEDIFFVIQYNLE